MIARALGLGKVSLRDLEVYYSIEDVYLMVEVSAVEAYNSYLMNREQAARNAAR